MFRGCQVACIGFTFTKGSSLNQIGKLGECLRAKFSEEEKKHNGDEGVLITDSPLDVTCSTCPELKVRLIFLSYLLYSVTVALEFMTFLSKCHDIESK